MITKKQRGGKYEIHSSEKTNNTTRGIPERLLKQVPGKRTMQDNIRTRRNRIHRPIQTLIRVLRGALIRGHGQPDLLPRRPTRTDRRRPGRTSHRKRRSIP